MENEEDIHIEGNDKFKFKKIIIFSFWIIVIIGFIIIVYNRLQKCDDIQCNYEKIENNIEKAEFICANLFDDEIYKSLENMTGNIGTLLRPQKIDVRTEEGKLSGRFIGIQSKELKSIICEIPAEVYFYRQNEFDYYITITMRPLVVVSSWEDWIYKRPEFIFLNETLGG